MPRWLKRTFIALLLVAPALGAAIWTCFPAAHAAWAVATFGPVAVDGGAWQDPSRMLELRRQVQRHFLTHAVYIPMEDIVTSDTTMNAAGAATAAIDASSLSLLMQKACGRGRLFVWIPFKFQLPVAGEKVIEWCWKPQTNDA